METTSLKEVNKAVDGQVFVSVQGRVKYCDAIKEGVAKTTGKPWSMQPFVLTDGREDVRVTLWDATDENKVEVGQEWRFESTKDKVGRWHGLIKKVDAGKDGKFYHKLEMRAEQTKWFPKEADNGAQKPVDALLDELPMETGIEQVRQHLTQAANFYNMCVDTVDAIVKPNMQDMTDEMFQSATASLFIEGSRQGLISKMPKEKL